MKFDYLFVLCLFVVLNVLFVLSDLSPLKFGVGFSKAPGSLKSKTDGLTPAKELRPADPSCQNRNRTETQAEVNPPGLMSAGSLPKLRTSKLPNLVWHRQTHDYELSRGPPEPGGISGFKTPEIIWAPGAHGTVHIHILGGTQSGLG